MNNAIKAMALAPVMLLASCASTHGPTMPEGKIRPVNSLETVEKLHYDAGRVIVGENRDKKVVKEFLLYKNSLITKPREEDPANFVTIDGSLIVDRTVRIPFGYGSVEMVVSPKQRLHLMQLVSLPNSRFEVRGRTDSKTDNAQSRTMARRRAESAKRYLIDHGVPSELISVNYMSTDDNIAGRGMDRRVEISVIIEGLAS